jgi:Flp pilus assembly protein TadD
MSIDREATLKKAEKLLRQGKLSGAIDEYVRLVADQPRDWNTINTLGDRYLRLGDSDRALSIFQELAQDGGEYWDVRDRIDRRVQSQQGSPRA